MKETPDKPILSRSSLALSLPPLSVNARVSLVLERKELQGDNFSSTLLAEEKENES